MIFIKSSGKRIYESEMDPGLVLCCKNASKSYKSLLEKVQKPSSSSKKSKKREREIICNEIETVKRKKVEVLSCI